MSGWPASALCRQPVIAVQPHPPRWPVSAAWPCPSRWPVIAGQPRSSRWPALWPCLTRQPATEVWPCPAPRWTPGASRQRGSWRWSHDCYALCTNGWVTERHKNTNLRFDRSSHQQKMLPRSTFLNTRHFLGSCTLSVTEVHAVDC